MKTLLVVIIGGLFLSWPAFYNGYPIPFPDTDEYINPALDLLSVGWISPSWSRPVFYGIFMMPVHLKASLWPIVFVQGVLLSYFLYLTMRVSLGRADSRFFLLVVFILSLTSTASWFAVTLIPDIFASLVLLGIYLLAMGQERLSSVEQYFVLFVTTAATAFHFSHIGLAAALILLAWAAVFFNYRDSRVALRAALFATLPFALAATALVGINYKTRGEAVVATHGDVFVANKFRPVVQRYLQEHCPSSTFVLCDHLEKLEPRDGGLLWEEGSLVAELGANAANAAVKEVLTDALWEYKGQVVLLAVKSTFMQFVKFSTEGLIKPLTEESVNVNEDPTFIHFPNEVSAYAASRQHNRELPLDQLNTLHSAIVVIALPFFLYLGALAIRGNDRQLITLFVFIVFGLLANAAICSILSAVVPRYQSRLAWLFIFFVLLAGYRWLYNRRERGQ